SRRRHTRFSRDWSSDVCSSDLSLQQNIAVTRVLEDYATVAMAQSEPIQGQRGPFQKIKASALTHEDEPETRHCGDVRRDSRQTQIGRAASREKAESGSETVT